MILRHRTLVKRLGRRQSKNWRNMLLPHCVLFTSTGIAVGAWTGTAFGSTVCSSLVLVDKLRCHKQEFRSTLLSEQTEVSDHVE